MIVFCCYVHVLIVTKNVRIKDLCMSRCILHKYDHSSPSSSEVKNDGAVAPFCHMSSDRYL
jgi:hypothetical protein